MIEKSAELIKGQKSYKIILVGSQAVGKSSLLHRIIESKFDPNYTSTIGVDFKTLAIPIGTKKIILQIWDTAGQQKFKALTQSYFRGANGCICVYDINQKQSLSKAEGYLRDAFDFKIKPDTIYLLANKSDQCQNTNADSQGRQLANKFEINFAKVSAKTGDGLGSMIQNLAVKIENQFGKQSQQQNQQDNHKRPRIRIDDQSNKRGCNC